MNGERNKRSNVTNQPIKTCVVSVVAIISYVLFRQPPTRFRQSLSYKLQKKYAGIMLPKVHRIIGLRGNITDLHVCVVLHTRRKSLGKSGRKLLQIDSRPALPMLFQYISTLFKVLLHVMTCASAMAPSSPMLLQRRIKTSSGGSSLPVSGVSAAQGRLVQKLLAAAQTCTAVYALNAILYRFSFP